LSEDYDDEQQSNKKKRILTSNQRTAANIRERKRMTIMNDAFVDLRHKLPISTGRKRRKMSRLDIVIGAMEYISYLDTLLKNQSNSEYLNNTYQYY
jgi:Fer3-like protein